MKLSGSTAEQTINDDDLKAAFTGFVYDGAFPCLGAKAAFNTGAQSISIYDRLASPPDTEALAQGLEAFVNLKRSANSYATYVAIFREPRNVSEEHFEELLWAQLQDLNLINNTNRRGWDPTVASDPADPRFSFSFAGQALYVVGLHGRSSRLARRFCRPTLVFNPHEQFERLRHDHKWVRMQRRIRARDVALQGSSNPMLSEFGERSEARQYSGRKVEETWEPPLRQRESAGGRTAPRCPFGH